MSTLVDDEYPVDATLDSNDTNENLENPEQGCPEDCCHCTPVRLTLWFANKYSENILSCSCQYEILLNEVTEDGCAWFVLGGANTTTGKYMEISFHTTDVVCVRAEYL